MTWQREVARTGRALVRRPAFVVVASITLGLGLAAFVTAFTLFDALLLRSPPFANYHRLAVYGWASPDASWRVASPMFYASVGKPDIVMSRGFASMPESANVNIGPHPELLRVQRVDAGFLDTLGVSACVGRASMQAGEAIASHALWIERFDGDRHAVGRTILVNGRPVRLVGVLPPGYRFLADVDLLMLSGAGGATDDNATNMVAVARLSSTDDMPAFSAIVRERVHRDAATLRVDEGYIAGYGATSLDVMLKAQARPRLGMFLLCATLVLIIAGVNVFNLMLIRAAERAHDTAVRAALGAGAWRVCLPAIAEAVGVASVAAMTGLLAGGYGAKLLWTLFPSEWHIAAVPPSPGWLVGSVACAASIVIAFATVCGDIAYALSASSLRERFAGGIRIRAGAVIRYTGTAMVFVQTALATTLLTLCVALASDLWRLQRVPLGFDVSRTMIGDILPDDVQYPDPGAVSELMEGIRRRFVDMPGIDHVGISTHLPVGRGFVMPFRMPDGHSRSLQYGLVTPGAMASMGVVVVAGRDIAASDGMASPHVALVNRAYVEQIDGRGLGATVITASRLSPAEDLRIVGVVADTLQRGPADRPVPTVYLPIAQVPSGTFAYIRRYLPFYLVARGPALEARGSATMERTVAAVAPHLAVARPRMLAEVAADVVSARRRDTLLVTMFAAMALALGCIGIYSSQSVVVASRRRELALRSAMGAFPSDLYSLIVADALRTGLAGVAMGLLCSLYIRSRTPADVIATQPLDPALLATVALGMLVAMALAVTTPAMRAAAIDPSLALRGD